MHATSTRERAATLLAAMPPFGHWHLDMRTMRMEWSQEVYAIHGVSRGAFDPTLAAVVELVHPRDRRRVADLLARGASSEGQAEEALRIIRPETGQVRRIFLRALFERGSDDRPISADGIVFDVTEMKARQRELLRQDVMQRTILSAADHAMVTTTTDGIITSFNPAAERLFGYSAADLIGQATPERFYLREEIFARAEELSAEYGRPIAPGFEVLVYKAYLEGVEEREWTFVRSDGATLPASLSVTPLRNDSGETFGYLGIAQDITVRKNAERAMREAKETAEAATRAKSQFLATLSHELRTPMAGLIGITDLLRNETSDEERTQLLETLRTSTKALMNIVGDVLDFSKIEASSLVLESIDFSIHELVAGVTDLFRNVASAKGVVLRMFGTQDPDVDLVRGDPTRLRQILSNLVGNAVKFTSEGSIRLHVHGARLDGGRATWRFEIADSGIGMDEATRAKLFQAFTQADATTTRRFGGSGLGLTIAQSLAEAMGSRITCESEPGAGSTFRFDLTLPLAERSPVREANETDPFRKRSVALDVLVAEDHKINQMLVRKMLERMGHVVTCVPDGRQALERAQDHGYDVILMDMHMPEMDGPTATTRIRAFSDVPIVALTADAVTEHRALYESAGLSAFLTKPLDAQRLGEILDGIAASKAAALI